MGFFGPVYPPPSFNSRTCAHAYPSVYSHGVAEIYPALSPCVRACDYGNP